MTCAVALAQLGWPEATLGQQAAAPTQQLYLDPATGAVTADVPDSADALALTERESRMLSASSQGLAVRRSGAGEGLTVHLQGRFRQLSVATVDAAGRVEHRCVGPADAGHSGHSHDSSDSGASGHAKLAGHAGHAGHAGPDGASHGAREVGPVRAGERAKQ